MNVALAECGKGVKENPADKEFERQFYLSLAQHNSRLSLLDWNKVDHEIAKKVADQNGPLLMERGNPDVSKYLRSTHLDHLTKRDAVVDKRSHETIDHEWRMQAWCAAFVNWCLLKVNVKPLGSARAADWLSFGTPLHHPSRGAIVVVAPSAATNAKGGSGHVAFFGGVEGSQIWMLGGNQHREVCWMKKSVKSVRGYRWPVILRDYPNTASDPLA
jgi:uncharacterized protein (TIGR02594 family)